MTAPGPPPVLQAERAFRAMGSDAHVLVWLDRDHPIGPEGLLDIAEAEVERLEQRWSRFRPDSDISLLNRAGGRPVPVAPETIDLLDRCRDAAHRTDGRFDPLVLPALLDAGYDRSFDQLTAPTRPATRGAAAVAAGPGPGGLAFVDGRAGSDSGCPAASPRPDVARDLTIDHDARIARLRPGAAIDVGGIGKGRAADLVATELVRLGAVGACANLGGDLRVTGRVPGAAGLLVAVEDPLGGDDLGVWSVHDAGVATSSRLRRRWSRGGHDQHHLIDPSTGRPARTDVLACTVVAPTGAWADVLAKAVLLAPPGEIDPLLDDLGGAAVIVHAGGRVTTLGDVPTLAGTGAPGGTR